MSLLFLDSLAKTLESAREPKVTRDKSQQRILEFHKRESKGIPPSQGRRPSSRPRGTELSSRSNNVSNPWARVSNVIFERQARRRLQGRECDLFKGFKVSDTDRGRSRATRRQTEDDRGGKVGNIGREVTSSLHNCVTLSGNHCPGRAHQRVLQKLAANWIPLVFVYFLHTYLAWGTRERRYNLASHADKRSLLMLHIMIIKCARALRNCSVLICEKLRKFNLYSFLNIFFSKTHLIIR